MAGIGDEVGAHLLDAAQRRQVVEGHEHSCRPRRRRPTAATGVTTTSNQRSGGTRSKNSTRCAMPLGARAADRLDDSGNAQRRARPARRGASAGAIALARALNASTPPCDRARSPGRAARPAPIRSVARRPASAGRSPRPHGRRQRVTLRPSPEQPRPTAPKRRPGPAPIRALRAAKSRRP